MRSCFSRSSVPALLALAFFCVPVFATEVKLVRVWPEYRSAESFVRVAEYFGGRETAPEMIVRSQPERRDGFYFLARFKADEVLAGAMLAVEYIVPGDELARVQFFPVDLPRGSRAVLAGVTGADWPGVKVEPTAWRVRLLGADGRELALQQSFLWSLPPGPAAAANAQNAPSGDAGAGDLPVAAPVPAAPAG